MKTIIIKGLEMPDQNGFIDARIYGDGTVLLPCATGECSTVTAEAAELPDDENK